MRRRGLSSVVPRLGTGSILKPEFGKCVVLLYNSVRYGGPGVARILYVEDNEDNIYMLKQRLERHHFEVLVARDGQAGIEDARKHLPDLILLDLSLAVLDGWEAARILKQDERTGAIPIIALSAHAMDGDGARALASGCDEYGTKPVNFKNLLNRIAVLLGRRAASDTG